MQQLRATNAQLSDTNRELEEQSRFKSEFLANMSHELRTPLNAVIGFSEMLKDGMAGVLTERQRTFAGHIYKGGHHLLALINDILDLSKIEAGKVDIRSSACRRSDDRRGADDGGRTGAQPQRAAWCPRSTPRSAPAGGPPAAEADRAQSGGQRRQVHARRRPGDACTSPRSIARRPKRRCPDPARACACRCRRVTPSVSSRSRCATPASASRWTTSRSCSSRSRRSPTP